jgi:hypothetical protein
MQVFPRLDVRLGGSPIGFAGRLAICDELVFSDFHEWFSV